MADARSGFPGLKWGKTFIQRRENKANLANLGVVGDGVWPQVAVSNKIDSAIIARGANRPPVW